MRCDTPLHSLQEAAADLAAAAAAAEAAEVAEAATRSRRLASASLAAAQRSSTVTFQEVAEPSTTAGLRLAMVMVAAAAEDEAAEAVEAAAAEDEAAAAASDSHALLVPPRPHGNAHVQLAYYFPGAIPSSRTRSSQEQVARRWDEWLAAGRPQDTRPKNRDWRLPNNVDHPSAEADRHYIFARATQIIRQEHLDSDGRMWLRLPRLPRQTDMEARAPYA